MKRIVAAALALGLLSPAIAAPPYRDLTGPFAVFADKTATRPDAERLARFQAKIAPLFPAFYQPTDGETRDKYEARVLKGLKDFPALRDRYKVVQASFPKAYAAGIDHFRHAFPDFEVPKNVVFLHSLGQMDGGTRDLGGAHYMLFGADGIALYHDPDSIGPFFDHELFHTEQDRFFKDCDPVWCGLWQEGMATYAASVLNPGADDRILMLTTPKPIRPTVDAHWREALCLLDQKRNSTAKADYGLFFFGNANQTIFPSRFGYYLGFRLAQRAAKDHSLQDLTHMGHEAAQKVVETTLAAMIAEAGGCPAPATPSH